MGIREPIMLTDHRLVMGKLMGEGARRHHRYCKERSIWPIAASKGIPMQEGDAHFSDLKKMVKNLLRKARTAAPCISDATCRLADQRTALERTHKP